MILDQDFKGTYSGEIIGSGSLAKAAAGLLELSGYNSGGGTTIRAEHRAGRPDRPGHRQR